MLTRRVLHSRSGSTAHLGVARGEGGRFITKAQKAAARPPKRATTPLLRELQGLTDVAPAPRPRTAGTGSCW